MSTRDAAQPFTLVNVDCPVCGSPERTLCGRPGRMNVTFQRFARSLDSVQVARCSECTVLYLTPRLSLSDDFQRELYNINYFASTVGVLDHKNMAEKERLLDLVAAIGGPLSGKCLLDIGCGTGEYLTAAASRGMQVTGIDVDQTLADYIGRQYGHRVITGQFGDDTFPADHFDVIVLSHVIEHLADPGSVLHSIQRALKPDGVFLMCTPNFDSLLEWLHDRYGQWRHGRRRNYYLTPFTSPYHIVGFNLRSARRILARTGFHPVHVEVASGMEWEANHRSVAALAITLLGAVLGKGMALNTISRKC
jgi:2-polyprenyl-3-methyl-5-hydroxy-6-metoxy-1,4-benzoquinol methylase